MRINKLLLSIFILFFVMTQFVSAAEDRNKKLSEIPVAIRAKVATICKQPKLVTDSELLDVEMRRYMDENHWAYNTIIHADFNGDNLLDWALLVKCKGKDNQALTEKLIVLMQKDSGDYNIHILEEFPDVINFLFIVEVPPKKVKDYDSDTVIKLRYKSIERAYFEKSSGIYYWHGNKFHYVQTSD